ncbi:hypothetical protein WA158_000163 [Blastocystis sp. Blastoise]
MPGEVVPNKILYYKVGNLINSGGNGCLFHGTDPKSNSHVAIKKGYNVNKENGLSISVIREIKILMELNLFHNPYIVQLYDVFSHDGFLYTVLNYCPFTISTYIKQQEETHHGISIQTKKTLFYMLLKGIQFLHENEVIHRDIKPSNLLLNTDGILNICDFGSSLLLPLPYNLHTTITTLSYAPPEVFFDKGAVTRAVDLWSAGCVFVEIFTGNTLFEANTEINTLIEIANYCGEITPSLYITSSSSPLSHFNTSPREHKDLLSLFPDESLSPAGMDLLSHLLDLNPKTRFTATQALSHDYFTEEPLPLSHINMVSSRRRSLFSTPNTMRLCQKLFFSPPSASKEVTSCSYLFSSPSSTNNSFDQDDSL